MDQTTLVTSDAEIEGKVVSALSRARIPVTAVDWSWDEELEKSQLIVVTRLVDARGPRETYARIIEALGVAGVYQSIPIRKLFVKSPEDPVAQKLVDDNVKGMLGHFNSGTTIPASRIYANAGIPEIAMATAPEYTTQGYKTAFRMMTSDTQQGSVAGEFAVKTLKMKKIAIVDDRTAYGQGLADQFEKAAKASGATIVDREYANDKAVDFKAILTKIKSLNPDLVYYGGADSQAGPMVKQMKTLGLRAPLMAGEMVKTDTFLKIAGNAADGTVASLAGLPLDEMPGGAAYVAKYKARFNEDVQTYSPYAYDGAMAMFAAMKSANSTDPAKYLPLLAKTDMAGVTSKQLAYDSKGDLKNGGITLYKVVDGKWTTLQSVGGK